MKRSLAIAMLLVVAISPRLAYGQLVTTMTPQAIEEAIRIANRATGTRNPGYYRLQQVDAWGRYPVVGVLSTPFSRVVAAAFEAKRQYHPFSAADVAPELLAPELWIYASPVARAWTPQPANVDAVVIMPRDSNDRSRAIHPTRTEVLNENFANFFGMSVDGRGLVAVFPIELLSPAYDAHVIFDGRIQGCTDCSVQLKTNKGMR